MIKKRIRALEGELMETVTCQYKYNYGGISTRQATIQKLNEQAKKEIKSMVGKKRRGYIISRVDIKEWPILTVHGERG